MNDKTLVNEPFLIYADIEDGHLFLIQSVLVKDTDPELIEVMTLISERSTLVSEHVEDNPSYLYGKARVRRWKL